MSMIIVGSLNPIKIQAVCDVLADFPTMSGYSVHGVDVPSGVSAQPFTLEETVRGAKNRAFAAWRDGAVLSWGIESGLMEVPYISSGRMDTTVCVAFDGVLYHVGLSSCWEPPPTVMEYMAGGMDMSQAMTNAGYSNDSNLGSKDGAIGILSNGLVTRRDYTMSGIRMAMIHVMHH